MVRRPRSRVRASVCTMSLSSRTRQATRAAKVHALTRARAIRLATENRS